MTLSVACSQNIVNPETTSISSLRYLKSGFADGLISPSTIIEGAPQRAPPRDQPGGKPHARWWILLQVDFTAGG